jgi:hypothetical protein
MPDRSNDFRIKLSDVRGDLVTSANPLPVSLHFPGARKMSAMGEFESGNVDAAGEDVCRWEDVSGPARLPTPAAVGEQMSIASDDDADNGASATGVLTMRIDYLDANGNERIEDVTLNGTTPITTTATDMRFVNDIYALTVGSNGVAEGNISVYKTGGSIGSNLYQLIAAGGNKSLVPHRMVPVGKTLFLLAWHCEEAQGKRSAFRIRSTDMNGELIPGVFCFKDVAYLNNTASGERGLHGTPIPALSIVKVSHWDDVGGAEGSCGWWGLLLDN